MQSDKTKLEMLDGIIVRDLEELRQNFDLDKVIECFKNGMLSSWLGDRYYEEEVENLSNISFGDNDFIEKLCMILGVEYNAHNPSDIKSTRMSKLYQYTNDEKIISRINHVAFNQEELAELYDNSVEIIYLCEGKFNIPASKRNLVYVELGNPDVRGLENTYRFSEIELNFMRHRFEEVVDEVRTRADNDDPYSCFLMSKICAELNDDDGEMKYLRKGDELGSDICALKCMFYDDVEWDKQRDLVDKINHSELINNPIIQLDLAVIFASYDVMEEAKRIIESIDVKIYYEVGYWKGLFAEENIIEGYDAIALYEIAAELNSKEAKYELAYKYLIESNEECNVEKGRRMLKEYFDVIDVEQYVTDNIKMDLYKIEFVDDLYKYAVDISTDFSTKDEASLNAEYNMVRGCNRALEILHSSIHEYFNKAIDDFESVYKKYMLVFMYYNTSSIYKRSNLEDTISDIKNYQKDLIKRIGEEELTFEKQTYEIKDYSTGGFFSPSEYRAESYYHTELSSKLKEKLLFAERELNEMIKATQNSMLNNIATVKK